MSSSARCGLRRLDGRDRFIGIARDSRRVALVLEDARHQFANVVFVVNDQDIGGHAQLAAGVGSVTAMRAATRSGKDITTSAPTPPSARVSPSSSSTAPPWSSKTFDDDRQAEAGALGAGRHIGLEQLAAVLLRKALAVVADGNARNAVCVDREAEPDTAGLVRSFPGVNAFAGVLQHIGQRLRDQPAIEFGPIGSAGRSSSKVMSARPTRARNSAWRAQSARSSRNRRAFGMRAKFENSSTMRLMSSTCRMIVSVHWSKISLPSTMWRP